MTAPALTAVTLADAPGRPLLVVGPSLGTSAETLWGRCAAELSGRFHVVGWDLPGHGRTPAAAEPFTVADLAAAVARLVDRPRFAYAGVSVGGAVGLRLLLDAPERVESAVLLCAGARIGEPAFWRVRAAEVRRHGTSMLREGSVQRWFAAGFADREPATADALLGVLAAADPEGYAAVCEALAGFDVRDRLGDITAPVLAVAGAEDVVTPPESAAGLARGVRNGRQVTLDGVAHQAPAESPARVAALIREHLESPGMSTRRAVLGDAHVDRAVAGTTAFTADFQDLITRYAWGEIWTRPGLDRRSRSLITLTALVALGHTEEFAMHVRAARTNGLTADEISELLLQTAIYCGVPAANTAFRIAQRVLADLDEETP
ncbi:bifunctional 3-oxoadipate enol-lactonase/4-carboxymuconolactone decarboxylase PcaDC [Jidongwangia harbinensis]|uniref:bifunctional 3-oxoadipate enol-lactonase/4-carboxymuconolactone decarboxylase PcaDC n=1 Tax=Jidongwangia harbinensis TaxID=2878561 RepID=UPI001CDA2B8D|nr:4-carboxymuconolactone decarboxylase [Jidongwangia harbinensis]MCA2218302.1 4-carboxymuconolactone decarboxylase [Jidongwangia harbinensis]